MIRPQHLSMHYYSLGAVHTDILREIDLHIVAGARVAIAGSSGKVKTSLLLLSGHTAAHAGSAAALPLRDFGA